MKMSGSHRLLTEIGPESGCPPGGQREPRLLMSVSSMSMATGL
jgi:hypothetical protein